VYDFVLKSGIPTINIGEDALTNPQYYASSSLKLHANQLQFVCKQLRAETWNIVSGWKDLIFDDTDSNPAIENFHGFLKRCSSLQRQKIRKIVIFQANNESLFHRTGTPYRLWFQLIYGASHAWLYNFCLTHPFSHVIVRYDFLKPTRPGEDLFISVWGFEHACLRMTLRGAYGVSFSELGSYDPKLTRMMSEKDLVNMYLDNFLGERHMLTMEGGSWEVLGNLRMTVSRTFDEEALRNLRSEDYGEGDIDIDKRIEELRNLFEEGC
jgi:hypothetical protein